MYLEKANEHSKIIIDRLNRFAEIIEVTGEHRRGLQEVRELDFIMVLKDDMHKEFNELLLRLRALNIGMLVSNRTAHKTVMWKEASGLFIPSNIYIGNRSNYGCMKLLTTGTTHFNKYILDKWKKVTGGYHGGYGAVGRDYKGTRLDEYLRNKNGDVVDIYNEEEIFKRIGLDYIEPKKRSEWI